LSQFSSSLVRSTSLQGMQKIKEVLITIESMHVIPLMADILNDEYLSVHTPRTGVLQGGGHLWQRNQCAP
jgi:hypothetical protein